MKSKRVGVATTLLYASQEPVSADERHTLLARASEELGLSESTAISTDLLETRVRNAIEFVDAIGRGEIAD